MFPHLLLLKAERRAVLQPRRAGRGQRQTRRTIHGGGQFAGNTAAGVGGQKGANQVTRGQQGGGHGEIEI